MTCRDCDRRHSGCHSDCEGYAEYKKELERQRVRRVKREIAAREEMKTRLEQTRGRRKK